MIIEIVIFTLMLEIITVVCRYYFGSARELFKEKIRINCGYIRIVFLLLSLIQSNYYVLLIGWSLLLSDLMHHYCTACMGKKDRVSLIKNIVLYSKKQNTHSFSCGMNEQELLLLKKA